MCVFVRAVIVFQRFALLSNYPRFIRVKLVFGAGFFLKKRSQVTVNALLSQAQCCAMLCVSIRFAFFLAHEEAARSNDSTPLVRSFTGSVRDIYTTTTTSSRL